MCVGVEAHCLWGLEVVDCDSLHPGSRRAHARTRYMRHKYVNVIIGAKTTAHVEGEPVLV